MATSDFISTGSEGVIKALSDKCSLLESALKQAEEAAKLSNHLAARDSLTVLRAKSVTLC